MIGYRRLEDDGTISIHWFVDPDTIIGVIWPEAFPDEEERSVLPLDD